MLASPRHRAPQHESDEERQAELIVAPFSAPLLSATRLLFHVCHGLYAGVCLAEYAAMNAIVSSAAPILTGELCSPLRVAGNTLLMIALVGTVHARLREGSPAVPRQERATKLGPHSQPEEQYAVPYPPAVAHRKRWLTGALVCLCLAGLIQAISLPLSNKFSLAADGYASLPSTSAFVPMVLLRGLAALGAWVCTVVSFQAPRRPSKPTPRTGQQGEPEAVLEDMPLDALAELRQDLLRQAEAALRMIELKRAAASASMRSFESK